MSPFPVVSSWVGSISITYNFIIAFFTQVVAWSCTLFLNLWAPNHLKGFVHPQVVPKFQAASEWNMSSLESMMIPEAPNLGMEGNIFGSFARLLNFPPYSVPVPVRFISWGWHLRWISTYRSFYGWEVNLPTLTKPAPPEIRVDIVRPY